MGKLKNDTLYLVNSYNLGSSGKITGDFNLIVKCNQISSNSVTIIILATDSMATLSSAVMDIEKSNELAWNVIHNRSTEISVKDLPLYIDWPLKTDFFIEVLKNGVEADVP